MTVTVEREVSLPQVASLTAVLAGTETTTYITPAGLDQERKKHHGHHNIGLLVSRNTSTHQLTVTLTGADGNALSANNPGYVSFSTVGNTDDHVFVVKVTAPNSIVLSNGSTLGLAAGGYLRLWVVGISDPGGGTSMVLALINCYDGVGTIFPLLNGDVTTADEGGSGGADSAGVLYQPAFTGSGTKAGSILGYIDMVVSVPGDWGTATLAYDVKLWQPGDPLPGDVVQEVRDDVGGVATGTTVLPNDNTTPQITEGTQFMSLAITPMKALNLLRVQVQAVHSRSADATLVCALFRDSGADCVSAVTTTVGSSGGIANHLIDYEVQTGSTAQTTFSVRCGGGSAGTSTFNGSGGAGRSNGFMNSYMKITEVMV